MSRSIPFLPVLATAALALTLAACGSDTTGPVDVPDEPTFSAQLTGGDLARLDGVAVFRVETYNSGADRGFALRLIDEDLGGELVLRSLTDAPPGVGTHEIVPSEDREDATALRGELRYVANGVQQQLPVRSGTLRITRASATQLQGTIELRARRTIDAQQVILTATFSARPYAVLLETSAHRLAVGGAVQQVVEGTTVFGSVTGPNGARAWGMAFRQSPMAGVLSLGRIDAPGRPGVGTWQVSDAVGSAVQFQGGYIAVANGETIGIFTLQRGTVVITESTDQRVRGRVDVWAVGALTSEPEVRREIAITGTFDARPGDIVTPIAVAP